MENNILLSLERFLISMSVTKIVVIIMMISLITSIGVVVKNKKLGELLFKFGMLLFIPTILCFIGTFYFTSLRIYY